MKIEVYQKGGFIGDKIKIKDLNETSLNESQVNELKSLIQKTDFFNLNYDQTDKDVIGADLLTYEIVLDDKGKKSIVQLTKTDKNTPLDQFLSTLLTA
jgi:hypothetical protein